MDISSYVKQHREALDLAQRLQKKIQEPQPPASEITAILVELAGKLKFHLSMEDQYVYPKAVTSPDRALRSMAQAMQSEMLGISGAFAKYVSTWTSSAIAGDLARFRTETSGLLAALRDRIGREERSFYPLVHKGL